MAWKIDLHCHSFFSGDGVSSPEELITSARAKGLNGFALTDHNTCDGNKYLLDKGLLRADGEPVDGFLIIPGVEVTTAEGHLLCLGVDLPNLKGTPAGEVSGSLTPKAALPSRPILTIYSAPASGNRLSRNWKSTLWKFSTPPPP